MKGSEHALSELFASEAESGAAEALAELSQTLTPRTATRAARSRLLASARSHAHRWAPHFDKLSALFDLDETALLELAERSSHSQNWEAVPLAGVRLFHLQGGPAIAIADAGLVVIPAGTRFPQHRHLGEERTLVLEGALRDEDGTLYRPGDALTKGGGTSHAFRVPDGAPLVYAVVLFAPIEIDGVRFPPAR